jgi:antibiotic biosynthesis monooxygenase (ABM) superfamily enzyme
VLLGTQPICTFVKTFPMIEFDQYLGFLAFLTILTIGFWLMIFLITFVIPFWLTGNFMQWFKEKRQKAKQ